MADEAGPSNIPSKAVDSETQSDVSSREIASDDSHTESELVGNQQLEDAIDKLMNILTGFPLVTLPNIWFLNRFVEELLTLANYPDEAVQCAAHFFTHVCSNGANQEERLYLQSAASSHLKFKDIRFRELSRVAFMAVYPDADKEWLRQESLLIATDCVTDVTTFPEGGDGRGIAQTLKEDFVKAAKEETNSKLQRFTFSPCASSEIARAGRGGSGADWTNSTADSYRACIVCPEPNAVKAAVMHLLEIIPYLDKEEASKLLTEKVKMMSSYADALGAVVEDVLHPTIPIPDADRGILPAHMHSDRQISLPHAEWVSVRIPPHPVDSTSPGRSSVLRASGKLPVIKRTNSKGKRPMAWNELTSDEDD